eukprot:722534-Rhodomonas_salina.1
MGGLRRRITAESNAIRTLLIQTVLRLCLIVFDFRPSIAAKSNTVDYVSGKKRTEISADRVWLQGHGDCEIKCNQICLWGGAAAAKSNAINDVARSNAIDHVCGTKCTEVRADR